MINHKEFENEDEGSGQDALALSWAVQTESFKEVYALPMEPGASSANSRVVINVSRKLDSVVPMVRREKDVKYLAAHVSPFKVGSASAMVPKRCPASWRVADDKHSPTACAEFIVTRTTLKPALVHLLYLRQQSNSRPQLYQQSWIISMKFLLSSLPLLTPRRRKAFPPILAP